MINLPKFLVETVKTIPRVRLRTKREFWASETGKDPRDLYWNMTGEPTTNPTDFVGASRMMFGSAVENQFAAEWISKLHFKGLYLVGQQIPVGGENPNWNGYVDFLLAERDGDRFTTWPVEFKVANGYGADMLLQTLQPKEDHIFQLGLYLRCFAENGKRKDGQLLYFLNSDSNLGVLVCFSLSYDPATGDIKVFHVDTSHGLSQKVNIVKNIGYVLDKWNYVLSCVAENKLPDNEFWYKKPLTPEFLAEYSDAKIKAAIEGNKILGDWQIAYSSYKDLHLKHFDTPPVYTEAERKTLINEYKRRHPKQRSY